MENYFFNVVGVDAKLFFVDCEGKYFPLKGWDLPKATNFNNLHNSGDLNTGQLKSGQFRVRSSNWATIAIPCTGVGVYGLLIMNTPCVW